MTVLQEFISNTKKIDDAGKYYSQVAAIDFLFNLNNDDFQKLAENIERLSKQSEQKEG